MKKVFRQACHYRRYAYESLSVHAHVIRFVYIGWLSYRGIPTLFGLRRGTKRESDMVVFKCMAARTGRIEHATESYDLDVLGYSITHVLF